MFKCVLAKIAYAAVRLQSALEY